MNMDHIAVHDHFFSDRDIKCRVPAADNLMFETRCRVGNDDLIIGITIKMKGDFLAIW